MSRKSYELSLRGRVGAGHQPGGREPVDDDLRVPTHFHRSDSFRISLQGELIMAAQRLAPGTFRFQEAGEVATTMGECTGGFLSGTFDDEHGWSTLGSGTCAVVAVIGAATSGPVVILTKSGPDGLAEIVVVADRRCFTPSLDDPDPTPESWLRDLDALFRKVVAPVAA